MAPFPFRETRIDSNLPVWLSLKTIHSQKILPGRIEATLINVSKGGACVFTPSLQIEGKHLFFSTLNSNHHLVLENHDQTDNIDDFHILARSIWMDSCQQQGRQYFKVGVCFATPQKKLFDLVKKYHRSVQ